MKQSRRDLVAELVNELQPVKRPGRIAHMVLLWLVLSWTYTVLVVSATGAWRPGAAAQLAASPQFLAESLLGLAAGISLVVAGLRLGIPDPAHALERSALPLFLAAAWACCYLLGLISPALDPSMLGKRQHCWLETLIYAMPPLLAGLLLLRHLLPLHPATSGALMGLAAGALPALAMQFACMYDPAHALSYHLAPTLAVAGVGAAIAPWLLARHSRSRPPTSSVAKPGEG